MKSQGWKIERWKEEKIKRLPDSPGVYFFLRGKKIIYIGKATSLRDRVRSYFSGNIEETRGPLIVKMLNEFTDIKFQKTDSVLEALILEANLIKKYQPEANTSEKDDKSFNFVIITKEDFPRVLVMRGRKLSQRSDLWEITKSFGPFTNSSQLKEAMKLVRKIFPFRDKCNPPHPVYDHPPLGQERENHKPQDTARYLSRTGGGRDEIRVGRPCFNRQIGLCPGVCTGEISEKDYAKTIKNIILFFEGKKKKLVKNLQKQMRDFAKIRKFEEANKIKKTIFALNHIQDVSLLKEANMSRLNLDTKTNFRIESYDVAHLAGTNMVGAMVVVENGEIKKNDYRKFKIRNQTGADDTKALSEILTRRLAHAEWPLPNLIVVDGGVAQKRAAEKVLEKSVTKIPVVSVVKDERHKPKKIMGIERWKNGKMERLEREILLANSEAHRFALSFHKHLRRKML
jgi:excinuclease ABC subunit C